MLSANLTASLYLISGIFFILALRGLSSPETSRTGNLLGILGMVIAILVTLLSVKDFSTLLSNIPYILIPLAMGGSIGALIASRIAMTSMPQLVAGFHSLVGLSAVLIAVSAFYNPESFGIGNFGNIKFARMRTMVSVGYGGRPP